MMMIRVLCFILILRMYSHDLDVHNLHFWSYSYCCHHARLLTFGARSSLTAFEAMAMVAGPCAWPRSCPWSRPWPTWLLTNLASYQFTCHNRVLPRPSYLQNMLWYWSVDPTHCFYAVAAMQSLLCNLYYATFAMQCLLCVATQPLLCNRCYVIFAMQTLLCNLLLCNLCYAIFAMQFSPCNHCNAIFAMLSWRCNLCGMQSYLQLG